MTPRPTTLFSPGTALVALLLLLWCLSPLAQSSGGSFEITSSTLDAGGGRSEGGSFAVTGTIGQADASLQSASGGTFQLTGGFWAEGAVVAPGESLFADSFEGL
ncbi:MAG: hypothetical protein QNJ40_09795 [Xanthomonadales bacterium]|nr:hypothetical protein [Xanthomonadales bacterium]